jgi:hypothetical protein
MRTVLINLNAPSMAAGLDGFPRVEIIRRDTPASGPMMAIRGVRERKENTFGVYPKGLHNGSFVVSGGIAEKLGIQPGKRYRLSKSRLRSEGVENGTASVFFDLKLHSDIPRQFEKNRKARYSYPLLSVTERRDKASRKAANQSAAEGLPEVAPQPENETMIRITLNRAATKPHRDYARVHLLKRVSGGNRGTIAFRGVFEDTKVDPRQSFPTKVTGRGRTKLQFDIPVSYAERLGLVAGEYYELRQSNALTDAGDVYNIKPISEEAATGEAADSLMIMTLEELPPAETPQVAEAASSPEPVASSPEPEPVGAEPEPVAASSPDLDKEAIRKAKAKARKARARAKAKAAKLAAKQAEPDKLAAAPAEPEGVEAAAEPEVAAESEAPEGIEPAEPEGVEAASSPEVAVEPEVPEGIEPTVEAAVAVSPEETAGIEAAAEALAEPLAAAPEAMDLTSMFQQVLLTMQANTVAVTRAMEANTTSMAGTIDGIKTSNERLVTIIEQQSLQMAKLEQVLDTMTGGKVMSRDKVAEAPQAMPDPALAVAASSENGTH